MFSIWRWERKKFLKISISFVIIFKDKVLYYKCLLITHFLPSKLCIYVQFFYLECILISEDFHQALNTSFLLQNTLCEFTTSMRKSKGIFLPKNSIKNYLKISDIQKSQNHFNYGEFNWYTFKAKSLTPHSKIPPKVSINWIHQTKYENEIYIVFVKFNQSQESFR